MLEAAGLLAAQEGHAGHQSCCESQSGACDAEACNLIESGNYQSTTASVAVPAPVLTACACLLCLRAVDEILPEVARVRVAARASFERPRDCSPTWQFVQRAAQPARAPSLMAA